MRRLSRRTGVAALILMVMALTISCSEEQGNAESNVDTSDIPAGAVVVRLTTHDMTFDPDILTVAAGETVAFVMDNPDRIKHDFTIDDFNGERVHVEAQPRSEVTFTLTMPDEPGEWRFYCSVPGHEALGMEGVLVAQ